MMNCPRCNGPWNDFDCISDGEETINLWQCTTCETQLMMNAELTPISLTWNVKKETASFLQWNFETNTCSYNVGSKKSTELGVYLMWSGTPLPWLPLNISLDKLKTYLLFL